MDQGNACIKISFLKEIFNAKESAMYMRDEETVMHAEIMIGNSTLMIADANEQWASMPAGIFIYVSSVDDTYRKALDAGAQSVEEPADKEYGRAAGILDRFGNCWWITEAP